METAIHFTPPLAPMLKMPFTCANYAQSSAQVSTSTVRQSEDRLANRKARCLPNSPIFSQTRPPSACELWNMTDPADYANAHASPAAPFANAATAAPPSVPSAWQEPFFDALADTGQKDKAARLAGHFPRRHRPPSQA
jgi:hypothetical protein